MNKDVSKAKEDITNNLTTLKQADKEVLDKIGTKQNGKVIKASNTIAQDLQALDTAIKNGGSGGGGGFNSQTLITKRFSASGARATFNAVVGDREDVRITVTVPDGYKTIGVIQAYTDYRCSVSLYNFINGIAYCTVYNSSGWANTPIGASVDVLFYKCK